MTELSQNLAQERSPKTWTRIGVQNSRARTCSKKSAEFFSRKSIWKKNRTAPRSGLLFFFKVQCPAATSDHRHAVANFSLNTLAPFRQPRAAGFFCTKYIAQASALDHPPPARAQQPLFFLRFSPAQRPIFFFSKHCAAADCFLQSTVPSGRVRSAPRSGHFFSKNTAQRSAAA